MDCRRILYVDDEPSARRALKRHFRGRSYTLVTAGSAREAMELIQMFTFDAAVLDVAMPGMNGFELMEALRRLIPGLPVVILTGAATDERTMRASSRLGWNAYLEKPCDPGDLEAQLEAVISESPGQQRRK